jgi:hypothetical protein
VGRSKWPGGKVKISRGLAVGNRFCKQNGVIYSSLRHDYSTPLYKLESKNEYIVGQSKEKININSNNFNLKAA